MQFNRGICKWQLQVQKGTFKSSRFQSHILQKKRNIIFYIFILKFCNDEHVNWHYILSVQKLITFQVAEKFSKFPEIITHFRTSFWNCSVPPFISRWAPIKAWKYKNPPQKLCQYLVIWTKRRCLSFLNK